MKIAIPIDQKSENATMASRFARAAFFVFYDLDTDKWEFIDNGASNARGGAGMVAVEFLFSQGIKAVIAPRVGPNAEQALRRSNITIYEGNLKPWKELVQQLKNNELRQI